MCERERENMSGVCECVSEVCGKWVRESVCVGVCGVCVGVVCERSEYECVCVCVRSKWVRESMCVCGCVCVCVCGVW